MIKHHLALLYCRSNLSIVLLLFLCFYQRASFASQLCQNPHQYYCSSQHIKKARIEWTNYKKTIEQQVNDYLENETYWDNVGSYIRLWEEDSIYPGRNFFIDLINKRVFFPFRRNSFIQDKLRELSFLSLNEATLRLHWQGSYSPSMKEIDIGHGTFVTNPKFADIVRRVILHEIAHSIDPVVFFLREDGTSYEFDQQVYPFNKELKKLNEIYPVGYDVTCLMKKKREGTDIDNAFIEKVSINKYLKDPKYAHLGCGNHYASEAFADYMAHTYFMSILTSTRDIKQYVFMQAVHFCSGKPSPPGSLHPTDRDRFNKILFSFDKVKKALHCK